MENKIIQEKENPLFNRKEVVLEIVSRVSPSNSEVQKLVSEKFSAPEEKIKIKGIYGNFGTHGFTVYANIYKTVKDKETTEIKSKKEREKDKKAFEERAKIEAEERKKSKETKEEVSE